MQLHTPMWPQPVVAQPASSVVQQVWNGPHRIRDDWHIALIDGDALLSGPLSTQHCPGRVMVGVELHLPEAQRRLIYDLQSQLKRALGQRVWLLVK